MKRYFRTALTCGLAAWVGACAFTETEEGAVARGDLAWARGDVEEALAEYRLALRQGQQDAGNYARAAHAWAELGRVDEAGDLYRQAVERDSVWADQAVSDLVHLARLAEAEGDRFGVASALQAAMEFRPGVSVEELALPMARHHSRNGEYGKALPYFQKALRAVDPDSVPEVLFETALAHEEVGDCRRALVFFEEYRDIVPRRQRGEVDWHIGSCSYRLAQEIRAGKEVGALPPPDSVRAERRRRAREAERGYVLPEDLPVAQAPPGRVDVDALTLEEWDRRNSEALRLLERTVTVGEPRNLQALAYYEKGEILAERGECSAAVDAFRRVILDDPSGAGPLVSRAQEWIDRIRFGPRERDSRSARSELTRDRDRGEQEREPGVADEDRRGPLPERPIPCGQRRSGR